MSPAAFFDLSYQKNPFFLIWSTKWYILYTPHVLCARQTMGNRGTQSYESKASCYDRQAAVKAYSSFFYGVLGYCKRLPVLICLDGGRGQSFGINEKSKPWETMGRKAMSLRYRRQAYLGCFFRCYDRQVAAIHYCRQLF